MKSTPKTPISHKGIKENIYLTPTNCGLSPQVSKKALVKKQQRLKDLNNSLKKLACFRESWSAMREIHSSSMSEMIQENLRNEKGSPGQTTTQTPSRGQESIG